MGMKRTQPQFWTEQEWAKEKRRSLHREVWKAVMWIGFWFLIFIGCLLAIGWIAANGRMYNW